MNSKNSSRTKKIVFIAGVVVMALAAGAAGAALVANAVIGSLSFSSSPGTVAVAARPAIKIDATKVGLAAKGSVVLYKKHAAGAALDRVYLPSEAVGGGLVATSDGWIITSSAAIAGRDGLVAVFDDKTAVAIDPARVVRDDATGVSFMKTGGQHLAVASFGDDTTVKAADPVFVVTPETIVSAAVLSPRILPALVKTDYVESTERLSRRMIMDRSGLPGAPVVDASGNMVGLDMGDKTAVPASFITQVLRELFKSGKIIRPNVGAHFVSLDGLPNAHDAGLAESGALVTGGGKYRATEKGSAAEAASLKDGDVITFVEHDRINIEETLSERLQDYAPGAKVELTVIRGGKELKLPLTLK